MGGAARGPGGVRRPRAGVRDRVAGRGVLHVHRPAEGAQHQGEHPPELRDAHAQRVQEGPAFHEARRQVWHADCDLCGHPWGLRREDGGGAGPGRGDRAQPARDVRAVGAPHQPGNWGGGVRGRPGHRVQQHLSDHGERGVLRGEPGGVRRHPVEEPGEVGGGHAGSEDHLQGHGGLRDLRRDRARAPGRGAHRPHGRVPPDQGEAEARLGAAAHHEPGADPGAALQQVQGDGALRRQGGGRFVLEHAERGRHGDVPGLAAEPDEQHGAGPAARPERRDPVPSQRAQVGEPGGR
mmetsp:Transcript_29549/g.82591  ORF Transcript_29549/g.82591 Transcript_29549/m.82591 type:complete len:294 (-) Transcript_29549:84-965(-)